MRSIQSKRSFQQLNPRFSIRRSSVQRSEIAFATVGILFYTGLLSGISDTVGAGLIITLLRYTIFLTSVFILLIDFQSTKQALLRGKYVWPLVLLTLASFLWSRLPASTIQTLRSDFIPITSFGLYLSARFSRKQLFEMISFGIIMTAAVSLFYAAFIPSIGRMPLDGAYPGAWSGLSTHKNGLGINLAMACVFAGIRLSYVNRAKFIYAGYVGVLTLLYAGIFLSQSTSALILSTGTLILLWLYKRFRWKGKSTVLLLDIGAFVSLSAIGAMVVLWTPLLELFGKDPTISGRTLIWQFLLEQRIPQSPILGFGKGVFWQIPSLFGPIYQFSFHLPAHAHNGYIEILLDLGFLGLLLFVISLIPVLAKVLVMAYWTKKPEDVWPLACLIIILLVNGVESALLRGASFFWLLYIVIACSQLEADKENESAEVIS